MPVKYDRLASHYDKRWRPYIDATLDAVFEVVDFQGNETVLDVPCGTGELAQRLLVEWPDLRIAGIDISKGMLARAKKKDVDNRVRWVEADVTEIPKIGQGFDCVICANSFHYFQTPSKALSAIHQALRPGGKFILLDWCDDYWTCKVCSLWLRLTDKALHRTYSLEACADLIEESGFQIDQSRRFRINFLWGLLLIECHRAD